MSQRLGVLKTYKLFIGGKFPRTESGRYVQATNPQTGEHLANYCHASRKDLRDAVRAARKALPGWASGATPYLKSQILYRAAEMLEGRKTAMATELETATGCSTKDAVADVNSAIDHLIHFAGWCDKFHQIFGAVNPVSSPHFSFSTHEPTGVVAVFCPEDPPLAGLVASIAPVILSGNTCVAIVSGKASLPAITFAETVATSDLPAGVLNILTSDGDELAATAGSHMDINAIVEASGNAELYSKLQAEGASNLKRISDRNLNRKEWLGESARDPYAILNTVEVKTAWHPIGS